MANLEGSPLKGAVNFRRAPDVHLMHFQKVPYTSTIHSLPDTKLIEWGPFPFIHIYICIYIFGLLVSGCGVSGSAAPQNRPPKHVLFVKQLCMETRSVNFIIVTNIA
jgi:hypothetical protein